MEAVLSTQYASVMKYAEVCTAVAWSATGWTDRVEFSLGKRSGPSSPRPHRFLWTTQQVVTQWCGWLRHCATSRKVSGSISDGVIGIFH